MVRFTWKDRNAIIECREFEDREVIVILVDGFIRYLDGSVSRFDRLLISKNEIGEKPSRRRRPK